jgi:predicted PurR-regulated permease PerM
MTYLSDLIYSLPQILLHLFIVLFIFFYSLIDKDKIILSIQEFLPFSKEIEKKLFQSTKDITLSVLYGWLIIGTIQGLILSVGIFILKVPNGFLISLLAILAGIFPIVGPSIVGVPIAIYFLLHQNYISALIIILFTLFSSVSDQLLRPLLVSKRTKLHPSLVLTGMIGGFLLMGIVGFIIGPLILAYLFTILEIYRNKSLPGVLFKEEC